VRRRLGSEVDGWIRAAITPPAELAGLIANLTRLEAQYEVVAAQVAGEIDVIAETVRGLDPLDSVRDARELEEQAADLVESQRVAHGAVKRLQSEIGFWAARNRKLLVDLANERAQAIIVKAAPLAAKLSDAAPAYDPAAIAAHATKPQLDAWREILDLDTQFQTLLEATMGTWWAATTRQGQAPGAERLPGTLRASKPGGVHVWARPHDVTELDVRDGRDTRLVSIVRWADIGGWRLSIQAVLDLASTTPLTNPWVNGERAPRRGVLIPDVVAIEKLSRRKNRPRSRGQLTR